MDEKRDWTRVSQALIGLHRSLIEHARRNYEREHGAIAGPAEFLRLLTTDAFFAWIRPLSELIVSIDEAGELDEGSKDKLASAVRSSVEQLVAAPGSEPLSEDFARHYWPLLSEDPQVTMAHAGVKQAISGWPKGGNGDEARQLHERHLLAEMVKQRPRRRH